MAFDEPMANATRWEMPMFDAGAPALEALPSGLRTAEQLDALEQSAYQEGFERGRAEGLAAGAREAREQAARLRALAEHLARPLAGIDAEVEQALVALTVQVARRLVADELALDPAKTLSAVREALGALQGPARDVQVQLHPDDAALLREHIVPPADAREFRVVGHRDLERGDVRVVTEGPQVDGRLDTREAGLARAVLGDEH